MTAQTNTVEPTPDQRYRARLFANTFRPETSVAKGLRAASYADSFPASYTEEAVAASRALIVRAASALSYLGIERELQDVLDLMDGGRWYR